MRQPSTPRSYLSCLLDVALGLAPVPEPAEQRPYAVAYLDAQGELWTDCVVVATSSDHAWKQVQAQHADAHQLYAATPAETLTCAA